MFKRMLLAVTFIAALGAASLVASSKATAHGCGYGGYGGYGYPAAYYPTYANYGYGYAPRVAYYPRAYPVYYRGFNGGHRRHHNGLTFTFGF